VPLGWGLDGEPGSQRRAAWGRKASRAVLHLISIVAVFLTVTAGAQPAAELQFPITFWRVDGNTLLPASVVEKVLAPHTTPQGGLEDIRSAQRDLEAAYRRAGYSAVTVVLPEQELSTGTVRLRIVEGKIGQVRLSGNRHFDEANLRASVPALREGATPNAKDIDANVRLANESPAKRLGVALSTGRDPGAVDARIDVEDQPPQRFGISADNTGNTSTGHTRVGVSYQNANLWNRDHIVTAQFLTSLEHSDRVQVYSVGYRAPIYAWNSSIDAFAAKSDVSGVSTVTTAGTVSFGGSGTIYGLRYNAYLPRIGEFDQKIIAGLDRRAYDNACTLGSFGAPGCGAAAADVTVRPLGLAWVGQLLKPGFQGGLTLGYARNVPGGSNGGSADFEAARTGAVPGYGLWRMSAQASFGLPGDWLLQGLFNGQSTRYALVPGEQFGIGGATSVRGFIERAAANDKGGSGSVELYTPDIAGAMNLRGTFKVLVFVDSGSLSRNHALPGEEAHTHLASVGFGARYAMGKSLSVRLDLAHPTRTDGHDSQKQQAHISMLIYF